MKKIVMMLILILLMYGQQINKEKSNLSIDGTSTLHDWTSIVESYSAITDLAIVDGELTLTTFKMTIAVTSIKSGKESMDENTYEAMEAEDFPEIIYTLINVGDVSKSDIGFAIETEGELTIHGVTKSIRMPVQINHVADGILVYGATKFKMSEYGVEPPSLFLGTINTGDEVTIKFNIKLN